MLVGAPQPEWFTTTPDISMMQLDFVFSLTRAVNKQ
jgi:hypothetical protein